MTIYLHGIGSQTFVDDLDKARVAFSRPPKPPAGLVFNASADTIILLKLAIPAFATVLCCWLKSRQSRYAKVTTKDGRVIETKGLHEDAVIKLLNESKSIIVCETGKPELSRLSSDEEVRSDNSVPPS